MFASFMRFAPQGPNSVTICRIDLKLGGNVSPDFADKMHFDSWPYNYLSGIYFKKCPLGHKISVYGKTKNNQFLKRILCVPM